MSNTSGDLTTSGSWDDFWANYRQPSQASPVRKRMRKQRQWEALLSGLLELCGPEQPVLELGCAPGSMISLLHSLRPDRTYRGIDYAPFGVEVARKHLSNSGIPAEIAVADIRDAKLEPASLVMSFGLIEHFDDPAGALEYHRRLTATDGYTAVTVPNYSHPLVRRMLARYSPETLETHNLEIMNPESMLAAFESAGFVDVKTGNAGTASIPSSRVRSDAAGRLFGNAARAWNLGTELLPVGWPWANHVWGFGRNPS